MGWQVTTRILYYLPICAWDCNSVIAKDINNSHLLPLSCVFSLTMFTFNVEDAWNEYGLWPCRMSFKTLSSIYLLYISCILKIPRRYDSVCTYPWPGRYSLLPNKDVEPGTENIYMFSAHHQLHCLKQGTTHFRGPGTQLPQSRWKESRSDIGSRGQARRKLPSTGNSLRWRCYTRGAGSR